MRKTCIILLWFKKVTNLQQRCSKGKPFDAPNIICTFFVKYFSDKPLLFSTVTTRNLHMAFRYLYPI